MEDESVSGIEYLKQSLKLSEDVVKNLRTANKLDRKKSFVKEELKETSKMEVLSKNEIEITNDEIIRKVEFDGRKYTFILNKKILDDMKDGKLREDFEETFKTGDVKNKGWGVIKFMAKYGMFAVKPKKRTDMRILSHTETRENEEVVIFDRYEKGPGKTKK